MPSCAPADNYGIDSDDQDCYTAEGDIEGSIVVDSGAAEHVMPKDILMGETLQKRNEYVNFVAANGKLMGNYGRKTLKFTPAGFQRPA